MSAPLTILDQIVANLLSTLAGVTTAGGFYESISPEEENTTEGNIVATEDGTAKLVLHTLEPEPTEAPTMASAWWQPFDLNLYVLEPADSGYSSKERCRVLYGEIVKQLMLDYHRGTDTVSGGALAVDTMIGTVRPVDLAQCRGAVDGMTIPVKVHYRHSINDPTILR